MSVKEAKPVLGGTRIRQRKRSINVPLDHSTFAEEVVAIFQDAATEEADVETNLVRFLRASAACPENFRRRVSCPVAPSASSPSLPHIALTRPSARLSSLA